MLKGNNLMFTRKARILVLLGAPPNLLKVLVPFRNHNPLFQAYELLASCFPQYIVSPFQPSMLIQNKKTQGEILNDIPLSKSWVSIKYFLAIQFLHTMMCCRRQVTVIDISGCPFLATNNNSALKFHTTTLITIHELIKLPQLSIWYIIAV